MDMDYRVEMAFDRLEEAIVCEEGNAESKESLEFYNRLLDAVVGLRDSAKKETAPAVSATEAEKENKSIFSLAENTENVNPRRGLEIQIVDQDSVKSTLRTKQKNDLALIYAAATEVCIMSAAEKGFAPEYIDAARMAGEKAAVRKLADEALDLIKKIVRGESR